MSAEVVPESASTEEGAIQGFFARLVGSPWSWVVFFSCLFGYHIGRAMLAEPPPDPPKVYYQVPEFELTDQFGKPFGSKDLRGKVWVAGFFFTHCPTVCEKLTSDMAKLQKRLKYMRDAVRMVSFSVDPENDDPETLRKYAAKHGANQVRWRFLTGAPEDLRKAVVEGFKQPMEAAEMSDDDAFMTITHGTRLVLVDQNHQIRGYYETDDEGIKNLLTHIALVSGFERAPGGARSFENAMKRARGR